MTATKIQPGDDTHLTSLMALHSLNLVTGPDRAALLAFGRDVFAAARDSKCLAQIEEPAGAAPAAVAGPAWGEQQVHALAIHMAASAPPSHKPRDYDADMAWARSALAFITGHTNAAPALEAPAQFLALVIARRALWAIAKTLDDHELRTRALEADDEIDRLLAAAPQAPAGRVRALDQGHHGAQHLHGLSPQCGWTASGRPTNFDTLAGSQNQGDGMGKFTESPCCSAQPSESHTR